MKTVRLDIGYELTPVDRRFWQAQPTSDQLNCWRLINTLAQSVEGTVTEQLFLRLLGLTFELPFRSRVKHLIEKGAIVSTKI